MHLRPIAKLVSCVLLCLSLAACFIRPYKFDIVQGNALTTEQIESVREGMSASEVHHILGSPMLQDAFHENRWDYIYYEKPGYQPAIRSHLAIFFENGRVSEIQRDVLVENA